MRKIILAPTLAFVLLVISGCGKSDQAKNNLDKNGRNFGNRGFVSSTMDFPHTTGTIADLKEGIKVMITGRSNSDGTMNASRIMVGDVFPLNVGRRVGDSNGPRPGNENQNDNPVERPADGENFNRPNMPGRTGVGMVRGEVIKVDESSLIVKEFNSGSKIVFYSDKTEVFILASTTSTLPNGILTTTTFTTGT